MKPIYNQLAQRISRELSLNPDDQEVIAYGLQILVQSILGIFIILAIGWFLGSVAVALAVASSSVIKTFSGGAHASRPGNCLIIMFLYIGAGTVFSLRYAQVLYPYLPYIVTISLLLVAVSLWRYAPVEPEGKPIKTEEKRRLMRFLSFVFLGVTVVAAGWLMVFEPLSQETLKATVLGIGISLFWQAFILSPTGHNLIAYVDKGINMLWKGGAAYG